MPTKRQDALKKTRAVKKTKDNSEPKGSKKKPANKKRKSTGIEFFNTIQKAQNKFLSGKNFSISALENFEKELSGLLHKHKIDTLLKTRDALLAKAIVISIMRELYNK